MVLCTSCPSTYMAENGRAGQRFSQAPHPMHLVSFTAGTKGVFSSSSSMGTISIAPTGQCLSQFPHSTPSVTATQFFFIHTACPICVDDFKSKLMGFMAPVGQTVEHLLHSGLQYPLSYDITGCISVTNPPEGRST